MIFSSNSNIKTTFYNDRVNEVIAADIMAEPFTYVPIKARHMEVVGGNAVVFGNITEGYDVVNPEIKTLITYDDKSADEVSNRMLIQPLEDGDSPTISYPTTGIWDVFVEYQTGDIVSYGGYFYRSRLDTNTGHNPSSSSEWWDFLSSDQIPSTRTVHGELYFSIPDPVHDSSVYHLIIINAVKGINVNVSYNTVGGDTALDVAVGLAAALVAAGITDATSGGSNVYFCHDSKDFSQNPYVAGTIYDVFSNYGLNSTTIAYFGEVGYSTKYSALKVGASHGFGIVYKDRAGRQCSIVKFNNIYIPFYTEVVLNLLESVVNLKFQLSHTPPLWAETYEIVYFGNISMDNYLAMRADDIQSLGSDRYALDIQATITYTRTKNGRWKLADWVWQQGDRLRLIGTIDAVTGLVTKFTTLYDFEIERTANVTDTGAGNYFILQAIDGMAALVGTTNVIVEVYRPKKGIGATIAYGCGMVFDIATDDNGNKYHQGDINQVLDIGGNTVTPATVNNTANDCYKFKRVNYKHLTTTIQPFWVENICPSDWWVWIVANTLTNNGFPFFYDLSLRQTYLPERLRNGGFILTGTRTNNLAHFVYLDYKDLPEKDGQVVGLKEIGYTLKVVQEHQETSIYIQRKQTFNADGTSQFILTDAFLGEMRPLEDNYGSQHPDSILVNNRHLYYWDNNEGAFIRSDANGQKVLSGPEYKMSRWFKDLLKWINESGGSSLLQVRIGANNEHDEIWLTFRIGDTIKGVIFSEKQGRFLSEINQITECYVHLGNFFGHLYHQRLWIMNVDEGQDYLSWNGVPTYAELEVVSNIEPQKNKVFTAIAQFADHLLQSLARYVRIPIHSSGSNELMESNVPIWNRREGVWFGQILKDEHSHGSFATVYNAKMNGRAMRGRYCYAKFYTNEHTEKVRIDSIVIFSTPSERNV